MRQRDPTEPNEDEQKTLASWRLLFESPKYMADLDSLSVSDESVFGFEIEWEDIEKFGDLDVDLSESIEHTLACGNQVLKEQFSVRNLVTRPVIRIVALPANRRFEMSDLRMRDRNRLLSFDAVVVRSSPAIGWLKVSSHKCNDCGLKWNINERLARPREKVKYCKNCLDAIMQDQTSKKPKSYYKDPTDVSMVAEENFYEDVQYLEVISPLMTRNGMALNQESFQVVVFDEYVGQYGRGDHLTMNAMVAIDPLVNRDFIRDTRRMVYLKAHSIEEGLSDSNEDSVDDTVLESLLTK